MRKASGLKRGSRRRGSSSGSSSSSDPTTSSNAAVGNAAASSSSSTSGGGPNGPLSAAAGADGPSTNGGPGADQARRKPTGEEASLTAKNYRLAKELSDLRVRYRDETKVVTRLTMENMNLASRCREAISHVAVLKKELATHQRRSAEALALQRQQVHRAAMGGGGGGGGSGGGGSSVSVQRTTEMSVSVTHAMERDPLRPTAQPQQRRGSSELRSPVEASVAAAATVRSGSMGGAVAGPEGGPATLTSASAARSSGASSSSAQVQRQQQNKALGVPKSPKNAAPAAAKVKKSGRNKQSSKEKRVKGGGGTADDMIPGGDAVPADEMQHDAVVADAFGDIVDPTKFFPHHHPAHAAPSLPPTPENGDNVASAPPSIALNPKKQQHTFQTPPKSRSGGGGRTKSGGRGGVGRGGIAIVDEPRPASPEFPTPTILKQTRNKSISSSIDAFEASFASSFPDSFAPANDDALLPAPSLDIAFDVPEFSDPFFLTTGGGGGSAGGGGGGGGPTIGAGGRSSSSRDAARTVGQRVGDSPQQSQVSRKVGGGKATSAGGLATERLNSQPQPTTSKVSSTGRNVERGKSPKQHGGGGGGRNEANPGAAPLNLFPDSAMSTFEAHSVTPGETSGSGGAGTRQAGQMRVDTGGEYTPQGTPENDMGEISPRRPQKTVDSSARARYEKALNAKATSRSKVDREHQLQNPHASSKRSTAGEGGVGPDSNQTNLMLRRIQRESPRIQVPPSDGAHGIDRSNNTDQQQADMWNHQRRWSPEEEGIGRKGNVQRRAAPGMRNGYNNTSATEDDMQKGRVPAQGGFPLTTQEPSPFQTANASSSRTRASSSKGGKPLSPDSMNAEMRQLDALADGAAAAPQAPTSSGPSAVGKRRNVKKPVSYAEPSLSSKLRRGDVFFPKKDNSPPGPADLNESTVRPKNPEEVLQDLVAPSKGNVHQAVAR